MASDDTTPQDPSQVVQDAAAWEQTTWTAGSVFDDPFYALPSTYDPEAPLGAVIKCETVESPATFTIPPSTSLARIIYQSRKLDGSKVPVSAYVLFPYSPSTQPDGRYRVVAVAHGTRGFNPDCAPSHRRDLGYGYGLPFTMALQGFVVVATDYAGLGVPFDANGKPIVHEYLANSVAADDVLFSLEAARSAFPRLSDQFIVIGHSQGGGAAWAVAEKMARDPLPGYLGAIPLAPFTKLWDIPSSNPLFELVATAMLDPVESNYPNFNKASMLNDSGRQLSETLKMSGVCTLTAFYLFYGKTALVTGYRENKQLDDYINRAAVGRKPVKGPILFLQGEADVNIYESVTTKVVEETAKMNPDQSFEYIRFGNITHDPVVYVAQPHFIQWIRDRFDGKDTTRGFSKVRFDPARPVQELMPESNSFTSISKEFYQV